MPTLIKNRSLAENQWSLVRNAEEISTHSGNIIVPVQYFNEMRSTLEERFHNGQIALLLESHHSIDDLPEDYEKSPLIAIDFPVFSDGRAYSIARDLRETARYTGEIRAVGDVLPDQLHAMERCGFNAFELAYDKKPEKVLSAFDVFSSKYQADLIEKKPVYRRSI